MTTTTAPAAQLGWLTTAGHGYLMVYGDLATARRCSTGYDFATADCVYLEEDCSAGIYLRQRGMTPEQSRKLPDTSGELPARARRIPAGDLGADYLAK